MPQGVPPQVERRFFDALLDGKVFERSPSQEKLIRYLFEKHQAGEAKGLKEYTIAVDAFHRPADFEPKDDSIVRVEMLRLRRRLQRYYEGPGSKDPVRIKIPEKSYDLEFELLVEEPVREEPPGPVSPPEATPARRPWRRYLAFTAGAIAAIGMVSAAVVFGVGPDRPSTAGRIEQPPPAAVAAGSAAVMPEGDEIRILAGRGAARYVDAYGHVWEGDRWYSGGECVTIGYPQALIGYDRNVLSGYREGNFSYDIPLQPGSYELLLGFAGATLASGQEFREFSVFANEQPLLRAFDPAFAGAGSNVAYFRRFKDIEPGDDGMLHLRFRSAGRLAYVNSIQIQRGERGRMRPIRMVARGEPFRDSKGNVWEPEQFYQGGRQVTRPDFPPATEEARLFAGERYGRFSYRIPVPPGRYTANLYFWESWWGENRQGRGGAGSRVFHVFCNFRPLVENLDLLAESAGSVPARRKQFTRLEPGPDGYLQFDFVPVVNNAMINAIEILDESR